MTKPDLSVLNDVVVPNVLHALSVASHTLKGLGVRHVVVGGLAVGANGYPRATRAVEFLVGHEAFDVRDGGFVTMLPGVPIQINGVAIELLSATADEGHLAEVLSGPSGVAIDAPRLVYMKLKAGRIKDRSDVVELVKSGIDADACRAYLTAHAPEYLPGYEALVAEAVREQDG